MPGDIQERFGKVELTTLNGEYIALSPDQAPLIVAAFEADGFIVARDQEAVSGAGY